MDAFGYMDRDLDDAELLGLLEQTGYPGLRKPELLGDAGLADAALVIHPRDARCQPQEAG